MKSRETETFSRPDILQGGPFNWLHQNLWFLVGQMTGLGLGTETFLFSVLVSVPVRPKVSGLEKVSVSRDFI